jgi:hypothetical protein
VIGKSNIALQIAFEINRIGHLSARLGKLRHDVLREAAFIFRDARVEVRLRHLRRVMAMVVSEARAENDHALRRAQGPREIEKHSAVVEQLVARVCRVAMPGLHGAVNYDVNRVVAEVPLDGDLIVKVELGSPGR